jgi:hypothetical protein
MTLSRMSMTVPAELLDAVVERTNRDKVTRSTLTIEALTAYLEGRIIEPDKQDNIEVIRLRTQLEGKDESTRRADETIDAIRSVLDICNKKSEKRKIEGDMQNSDLDNYNLRFLEANNPKKLLNKRIKGRGRDSNQRRGLHRCLFSRK